MESRFEWNLFVLRELPLIRIHALQSVTEERDDALQRAEAAEELLSEAQEEFESDHRCTMVTLNETPEDLQHLYSLLNDEGIKAELIKEGGIRIAMLEDQLK